MAGTGSAGDGGLLFRGVFEGSISGNHTEVERRPYHKNCSCALHDGCRKCPHRKASKVSYPIRRSWSEGSFPLYAAANATASSSVSPSPSSSPAIDHIIARSCSSFSHHHHHLPISNEQPDQADDLFPSKIM